MLPTPPAIDAQLSDTPSPTIPGAGDAPTPPQLGGERFGANNMVRPGRTAVKASGKAGGKRVEAPEVAPRPSLAPVAGRLQSKPTPAKVALTEAVAKKKRKKTEAALPKDAAASSTHKASTANPLRGRPPLAAVVNDDEREVFDGSSASAVDTEVASFMSELESSHAIGIDDLNLDDQEVDPTTEQREVEEEEVEEVKVEETQGSAKKSRASNYSKKEEIALCYAWMNVLLAASVGTDQSKEKFWARIEEYYTPYLLLLSFGKHFPRVSYKDLAQATQSFSESNLIGRGSYGSVYRGKLTQAKIEVAIKVFDLDVRCADKSFIAECEALRSIRHRNLISILTACSTIDSVGNAFKAVIYEFMPNRNLDTWLHRNSVGKGQKSLGLGQRISMAVNIADALAYIHHDITRSVVHCDLKPSNVLLDTDMNAYLGDFGIANLVHDSKSASAGHSSSASTSDSSIGLKGTIGYIAPEYAQTGQASTYGDVYSFGIVLLEMPVGKRPTDPMFGNELNIVNFAERNSPDQILHIVDAHLQEECKEFIPATGEAGNMVYQCLMSLVQVALSCTGLFPRERINMREVVMKLHAVRTSYVGATKREHVMPR